MVLFGLCYETVEVRKQQKYTNFFRIIGRNSILAYLAAAMITRILLNTAIKYNHKTVSAYSWIYKNVFLSFLNQTNASFVFSIAFLMLIWLLLYIMNKKQLFIKI
jgi:predicted acyltransferase